jgi:hypothetical protein
MVGFALHQRPFGFDEAAQPVRKPDNLAYVLQVDDEHLGASRSASGPSLPLSMKVREVTMAPILAARQAARMLVAPVV